MNEYTWTSWFAWYTVKLIDGGYTRFRWVERRHIGAIAPNGDLTDYWEYRTIKY